MRKVITINLNGNAYQVDEVGYEALRTYLERAEAQLAGNPDRAEILADLEQAIGDKCDTFLGNHKNVVSATEVEQLLKEMGPVEGAGPSPAADRPDGPGDPGGAAPAADASRPGSTRPRRLYRLPAEGMLGGVCAGLAAHFNIDVVWVRLIFVLLAFTTGVWFLAWLVMLIVMPRAVLPEDVAAAHGEPFNAHEILERAKKKYREFSSAAARAGRERWEKREPQMQNLGENLKRAERRRSRYRQRHVGYGAQVAGGVAMPVLSVLSAALFVAFVFAMLSLLSYGTILGWQPLPFLPHWVVIVGLIVCYCMVGGPISAARHASHRYANGGHEAGWASTVGGLLWIGIVVLLFWTLYQFVPGVRELMDSLLALFRQPHTITI